MHLVIACVGDSLTAKEPGHCDVTDPWPDLLQRALGNQFDIQNFGRDGARVWSYKRYDEYGAALESGASLVIVMIGTNDASNGQWEEEGGDDGYGSTLSQMISNFKEMATHPHIIVMVPPPTFKSGPDSGADIINDRLPALIPAVARKAGAACFSVRNVVDNYELTTSDSCDGTHWHKRFHAVIAAELASYIRRSLAIAPPPSSPHLKQLPQNPLPSPVPLQPSPPDWPAPPVELPAVRVQMPPSHAPSAKQPQVHGSHITFAHVTVGSGSLHVAISSEVLPIIVACLSAALLLYVVRSWCAPALTRLWYRRRGHMPVAPAEPNEGDDGGGGGGDRGIANCSPQREMRSSGSAASQPSFGAVDDTDVDGALLLLRPTS